VWWLLPLAHAATGLPAGLTPEALDDPAPWEERARILLDGPDSCVQLQGHVVFTAALFTPGGWLSPGEHHDLVAKGTFDGTLDHGLWTRLDTTWNQDAAAPASGSDGAPQDDQTTSKTRLSLDRPHPIVGRLPPIDPDKKSAKDHGSISISASGKTTDVAIAGGGAEALGLLDQIVESIDPAVTTAFVTWEEKQRAAVLRQFMPIGGHQGSLEITVVFPEGGVPTSLDGLLPKRFRATDGLISLTIKDAQLHLRSQQTPLGTLPGEEGVSMVVGVLGYTLGIEQRITYDMARACP